MGRIVPPLDRIHLHVSRQWFCITISYLQFREYNSSQSQNQIWWKGVLYTMQNFPQKHIFSFKTFRSFLVQAVWSRFLPRPQTWLSSSPCYSTDICSSLIGSVLFGCRKTSRRAVAAVALGIGTSQNTKIPHPPASRAWLPYWPSHQMVKKPCISHLTLRLSVVFQDAPHILMSSWELVSFFYLFLFFIFY